MQTTGREIEMITRKRTMVAAGAAVAAFAIAGTAIAAGPPASPPRTGAGTGTCTGTAQGTQGAGRGVMAGGVVMQAAAKYIGITPTELATARQDGKSLAQIATANGKTVAGLEAAMTSAFKANLDAAVKAGRITQAQADQMLAAFKANLDTMVNRTATGPMAGRGAGMGKGAGMGAGLGFRGGRS
jgi:hypothetical protein